MVFVRVANVLDAPIVSELLFEFNGKALPADALAERMAQTEGLEMAFLGHWDGALAGLFVLRLVPTLSDAEDWAEVTEMYVRPGFRRKKVGRALFQAAIAHARARGCRELHLLVDPRNTEAQSFYTALGFRLDSWEMRRRI